MSLPPGFLDELRNRLSLGQVVGRKVMWDARKSNPGKGDLGRHARFIKRKAPVSTSMIAKGIITALAVMPRAMRFHSCARPRMSISWRR